VWLAHSYWQECPFRDCASIFHFILALLSSLSSPYHEKGSQLGFAKWLNSLWAHRVPTELPLICETSQQARRKWPEASYKVSWPKGTWSDIDSGVLQSKQSANLSVLYCFLSFISASLAVVPSFRWSISNPQAAWCSESTWKCSPLWPPLSWTTLSSLFGKGWT
jgi:hypothetical protein